MYPFIRNSLRSKLKDSGAMNPQLVIILSICLFGQSESFNGDLAELECPEECECHYFRVNWVTDCSDSNLTEIPYSKISPNVYILDLNGNYIRAVKPFPPDIKMRRLQLADNQMTEVRKASFAELHYLIDADFANNQITKVDPYTFKDTAGFIRLELQDNPLEKVEGPFLYSNTLLYLDISNCGLQTLNPRFFANITSLSTLDLSNNPLKMIEGEEFYPLKSLERLKMNNCKLTFIAETAFKMQSNLKHLDLSQNAFTVVNWALVFAPLIHVEYLNLQRSGIKELSDDTFNNAAYLRTLILAENELRNLDVASTLGQKLTHLDTLDLSHCHLTNPLTEDSFANSTKIRTLYLSGNVIFSSELLEAVQPLEKLLKLSLSHCGLSKLPETLTKFKSLIELDISYNPLNDVFVKLLAPLDTLQYLNMGYSNLSYISPETFSKMTSMKRLILSGNDLHSLEAGLFANLTHLESLELNSCGLSRPLNATIFFNNLTYTDLTELQLANNPLRVSHSGPLLPKQFSRLQILDLSNCNLTFLPTDAFQWTRNITHLILRGNHFTSSNDIRFLNLLSQIQMIDLRYNKLFSLTPWDISMNPNVEKLKLIGNPWKCDCSIAELWNWALVEKGNLGILEGATIAAEHITVGKTKRKKLLICNYDTNKRGMTIDRKSPEALKNIIGSNRTWSKYVKESGCKIPKVHISRSIKSTTIEEQLLASANFKYNSWLQHFTLAFALYVFLMATMATIYIVHRYGTKAFARRMLDIQNRPMHRIR